MPFYLVLLALKEGFPARRAHWDADMYVKQVTFNGFEPTLVAYQNDDDDVGGQARFPGTALSWDDITAEDWELV